MELNDYWRLFKRRWLLVLVPAVVVLIAGVATYNPPPPVYNVGVRLLVSQPPAPVALESDEDAYYTWLESEYIVNALTDWVNGNRFGAAVSAELAEEGMEIPPGAIQGGLVADNARSMLTLSLTHGDPVALEAMMAAAITVLQEQNEDALPQLGSQPAQITALDTPVVNQIPSGFRSQLDLPLRLLIAVLAGVGLAFLVDYLDPTVREREEVEALGLPLLGEIPKKK